MSRLAAVRPALPGAARVLLAGGVAAGLVWGATTRLETLDLAAASGVTQAPVAPTSLATSVDAMCPGPELTGIAGVDDVRTGGRVAAATGPSELLPVPAAGAGSARASAGSTPLVTLSGRPADGVGDLPRTGPVTLRAQGALAPAVTATQEWSSTAPDLRGLVTTPCRGAATDLWLLGGGDGPGRLERLVLTNPGGNPVTADVTVHGADGPVAPARTETVPPGGRTTLLLDAVAADEKTPAVHVVADGGGLTAFLSDTWIEGTTPQGAETTVPAADPATVQVVPATLLGGRSTLRVLAPGGDEAVASVTLLGRDGPVTTTDDTVLTVGAEGVGELALPSVPAGTYSVVVRSDVPVVAGVLTRVGDARGAGDIGWAVSAPVVDEVAGSALPPTPGVTRTLHLVSTGGASTAEVTVVVDGEARTRTVALLSDRAADVDLGGAQSVWVERTDGSGALRGGLVSTSGSGAQQLLSEAPLAPTAVTSPVSRAFPLP
ncbi:DUF5719 family protein [Arthrobacter sp. NEB 688]|uniref:DUF5719 family protein n=1 Tax=Arthrobacter sp. NEB 688 TaxID=904039 RepID=UPI0015679607|nr:DUF5719 family protein [Arthrobacter sp. NEB 688]QKE85516.1 hypothetical protein HL663_17340 [Arthrobacter sp. NEB 688]